MARNDSLKKTRRMATIALFAATIVVLQILSAYIKIGTFNVTLILVPVVLSAVLFGTKISTIMGLFFGILTFLFSVMNIDVGGFMMFEFRPFMTAIVCLVKGTVTGLVSGLVYKLFSRISKDNTLGIFLTALVAPIVNTSLFVLFAAVFYMDILTKWANGAPVLGYVFTALIGTNMVFEIILNLAVCPVVGERLKNSKLIKSII